jgi:hypothetical protein
LIVAPLRESAYEGRELKRLCESLSGVGRTHRGARINGKQHPQLSILLVRLYEYGAGASRRFPVDVFYVIARLVCAEIGEDEPCAAERRAVLTEEITGN